MRSLLHVSHVVGIFSVFKTHHPVTLESRLVFKGMTDKCINVSTPIWTAFITQQIHSLSWISRPASTTVHLAGLSPYIFIAEDDYKPQISEDGKQELIFRSFEGT